MNPSSDLWRGIWLVDKNGYRVGGIQFHQKTNGDVETRLETYDPNETTTSSSAVIKTYFAKSGIKYATAPYRTSGLTDDDIITKRNLEGVAHTFSKTFTCTADITRVYDIDSTNPGTGWHTGGYYNIKDKNGVVCSDAMFEVNGTDNTHQLRIDVFERQVNLTNYGALVIRIKNGTLSLMLRKSVNGVYSESTIATL